MADHDSILVPVWLLNSGLLLDGGRPADLPPGTELISDLDRAMILENEQNLPPGYEVWRDVQDRAMSEFVNLPIYSEAEELIDPLLDKWLEEREPQHIQTRKDQIRGTATLFDEFRYTVDGDMGEQLKMISAARFCLSEQPSVFELMYQVFHAGFYPCGMTETGHIVTFDAARLPGGPLGG